MIDVKALLKKMTIAQKIGQLVLLDWQNQASIDDIRNEKVGALLNVGENQDVNELQRIAKFETTLGIPLLIGDDVIHGFKTIFPIPLAESCSWNLDLIEKNAHITKLEAYSQGINWIFAPMIDITHDPRWGRIMETCGEDPYLTSEMAKAKVRGIQKPINNHIVSACPKHFVGYGAVEAGLDYNTTEYSLHRLNQLYLPPFAHAIKAGALSIMSAFTTFNDQPITSSEFLLQEVLRKGLGFEGVLISDWGAIDQLIPHGVAKDKRDAGKKALSASVDVDLAGKIYYEYLETIISQNPKYEKLLDVAVERVLNLKVKLGLFDNPYSERVLLPFAQETRKMAKITADESIVLLKNDNNTLPLTDLNERILVIGPYVYDQDVHLGAWAFKGDPSTVVSVEQGLKQVLPNARYFPIDHTDIIEVEKLKTITQNVDKIIVTLGEPRNYSGENHNRQSLELPFNQNRLVEVLASLNIPLIALVFAGRPLTITNLEKYASSILWCWHLGVEAGNSIASILIGEVNPSAKLTQTFPKTLGQVPLYYNHYQTGRPELLSYVDGDLEPLYPFGYGLHYGNIKYHQIDLSLNSLKHVIEVKVELENESNYQITEIVQVYISSKYQFTLRPLKALGGFARESIAPNTRKEVVITINLENQFNQADFENDLELDITAGPNAKTGLSKTVLVKGGKHD